jgi:hypothetical protein
MLHVGTVSNAPINIEGMVFDEQYVLRWIDHTEPKEEPKLDDPTKMQVRMRCEFEIVSHDPSLTDWEGNPVSLVGQRVADFFTVSLHEKSNLGQAIRAMRGMKPDEMFRDPRFDIDSLCVNHNDDRVGGTMRATITKKTNGYPKLSGFLPVRGARNLNTDPGAAPVAAGAGAAVADPNEPPF